MVVSIVFPEAVFGQNFFKYKGPMKVAQYDGVANYIYKLKEKDTIFEGAFQIKDDNNLSPLAQKRNRSFLFTGTFKGNLPHGNWQFTIGEFQPKATTTLVDYQYVIELDGIQQKVLGKLDNGKPIGEWTVRLDSIENSDIHKTLFKSTVEFKNGVPQKSFHVDTKTESLVGRFLRNGLAHDQWTLYYNDEVDKEEHWYFDSGLLTKIETHSGIDHTVIDIYKKNKTNTKTINLDKQYIEILKSFSNATSTDNNFEQGISQLLLKNDQYYTEIEDILSSIGDSVVLSTFKVKVPYYPIASNEEKRLNKIVNYFSKSKKMSDTILNDTQLNILKLSDEETATWYKSVESITKEYLEPMQKVVNSHQQNLMQYRDRKDLVDQFWREDIPLVLTGNSSFDDKQSIREYSKNGYIVLKTTDLEGVYQIAKYTESILDFLYKQLHKKVSKERRQKEIISIEEKLIVTTKRLKKQIDSLQEIVPSKHKKALNSLAVFADDKLSVYSNMEETTKKLEEAKRLTKCFTQVKNLTTQIAKLPEQKEEIKQKYIDPIWNPFTSTIMDEEIKKRIVDAYTRILVPYALEQVETNLKCNTVEDTTTTLQELFVRMIALRDEDTSKIERKLRKEKDPIEILKLFGISTIIKEKE